MSDRADPLLLGPACTWCLDNLPAEPPVLVGLVPGPHHVDFRVIELDTDDPLADLATLAAPPDWVAAIVSCSGRRLAQRPDLRFAHVVDRGGRSHTEIRSLLGACGPVRGLMVALDECARALFGLCPRRRARHYCPGPTLD